MRDDHGFRPDLKDAARRNFSRSVRADDFRSEQQRRRAVEIANAERRAAAVREKASRHVQTMKPVWVERERARLARKNPEKPALARSGGPTPPGMDSARKLARQDRLTAQAEANVKERCKQRLRSIDKIEHKMVRAIGRDRKRNR